MIKRKLLMSACFPAWKSILPFIAVFAAFLFSCNDTILTAEKPTPGNKMQFACLRYDSAAIEYYLDSIHIRGFSMQFYLPEAGNNHTAYQLISYAFDTLGDYRNSWIPDTLHVESDSAARSFEGRVIMGNNEVTRQQINDVLNDESGKRISYDYILLEPTVEKLFHHLIYTLKPIKNKRPATGNLGKMQISSPLPPARVW